MIKSADKNTSIDVGCDLRRRSVLKKYGAYSAPTIIALVYPGSTEAHLVGTVYSSLADCLMSDGHMSISHCIMRHDV